MGETIRSVRGMRDILPAEAGAWRRVESVARDCLESYGYREIRTPIVERTELFRRQLGEHTELVEKEMYTFEDRLNGESLTLRPEATVSTMRALLEHGLLAGRRRQKVHYCGPMFRHERPQQGRHRQFHQIGAEAVGHAGPNVDVELVLALRRMWARLGIGGRVRLKVNNLGDASERAAHRRELTEHFRRNRERLDEHSRRRLETNPLRILDSKSEQTRAVAEEAPRLDAHLGGDSRAFFDGFLGGLAAAGVAHEIDHRLVRGLDYYGKTVFEWVYDGEGKELTLCGGGRYDGLAEQVGGPPIPGCGFALGTERLVSLLADPEGAPAGAGRPDVFVVAPAAHFAAGLGIAEGLRDRGMSVAMDDECGSFRSQLRQANASGAAFAVLVGDEEVAAGEVSVKPLRDESGQFRIGAAGLADRLETLRDNGA